MHIVVELEGVLQGPYTLTPIPEGVLMTGALSAYNQISFITDMHKSDADRWLNENKIVDLDNIIGSEVTLQGENLKERQLKFARANGGIGLFITSNPALWAFAFNEGIPSILFGVPSYLKPEYRPDAPARLRTWSQIEDAVRKQNEAKTKEARSIRTETVRFE